jgi:hypothetical protein
MRMQRRYHRLRQAARPVPACHEHHISVVGPPDAIGTLNSLIEKTPDLLIDAGVADLSPEPTETSPSVHAYVDGKWHPHTAQSESAAALSFQTYSYDLRSKVPPSEVTETLIPP